MYYVVIKDIQYQYKICRGGETIMSGYYMLVLHTHLPWVKKAGKWPFGEEWLYEAIFDSYLPLLITFSKLYKEGVKFKVAINITPVVAEMLEDTYLQNEALAYIEDLIDRALSDLKTRDMPYRELAEFWFKHFSLLKDEYLRIDKDVVGAFKALASKGVVELFTSAATHGFLPLLGTDGSINLQVGVGVDSFRKRMGFSPNGFWMPECAYRPKETIVVGDRVIERPGIEYFLEKHGIKYTIIDHRALQIEAVKIENGYMPSIPEGEFMSMQPYYLANSSVVAFPRHGRLSEQVWSAGIGYPGDGDYLEFHKRDSETGLKYWRITDKNLDLGYKDIYHPEWASGKIKLHARDFVSKVADVLWEYERKYGAGGYVLTAFDTELFGHWWFEGPNFLYHMIKIMVDNQIEVITPSDFLSVTDINARIFLPRNSWGYMGTFWVWNNEKVSWMWQPLYESEILVKKALMEGKKDKRIIRQMFRELLILEASDWQFLITTGGAVHYAKDMFNLHKSRVDTLAHVLLGEEKIDEDTLKMWEDEDSLFEEIDEKLFLEV